MQTTNNNRTETERLKDEVARELTGNILQFWMSKMQDTQRGEGFYGRIDGHEQMHPDAEKGAILNARILWTFSAAYRVLGNPEYLETATRAKNYILKYFVDTDFGGVYWAIDCESNPTQTKKQIYAIGFTIYGLSEYARATDDTESLEVAVSLYRSIEEHSYDTVYGGYLEAFTREWEDIGDMRLSNKDANERKTMNTHLHILEPYTNLYRVWPSDELKAKIAGLIEIFTNKIYDSTTGHLGLFFGDNWERRSTAVSYGHDIEASWLIHEAAIVIGDKELIEKVEPIVRHIAMAADEGLAEDGSLIYELEHIGAKPDRDRHWWVQAETVVGYYNLYEHFGDEEALSKALRCWDYIKSNLIDNHSGEWHWSIRGDGTINRAEDKAGFWKCPYHNGRMCIEIIERLSKH